MAPADQATQAPTADAHAPQPTESSTTANQAPPEKDWKEEYARLRQDYDDKAAELKTLKKGPKTDATVTPQATNEDDTLWLIENATELKMVKDEFNAYKAKGYSREDSLRLAKLDRGMIKPSDPNAVRQAAMSGETSFVNREGAAEVSVPEVAGRLGVKPETITKYKVLVEGEG